MGQTNFKCNCGNGEKNDATKAPTKKTPCEINKRNIEHGGSDKIYLRIAEAG
jgi:hypothetical protein